MEILSQHITNSFIWDLHEIYRGRSIYRPLYYHCISEVIYKEIIFQCILQLSSTGKRSDIQTFIGARLLYNLFYLYVSPWRYGEMCFVFGSINICYHFTYITLYLFFMTSEHILFNSVCLFVHPWCFVL